jgi:hypothetical protein
MTQTIAAQEPGLTSPIVQANRFPTSIHLRPTSPVALRDLDQGHQGAGLVPRDEPLGKHWCNLVPSPAHSDYPPSATDRMMGLDKDAVMAQGCMGLAIGVALQCVNEDPLACNYSLLNFIEHKRRSLAAGLSNSLIQEDAAGDRCSADALVICRTGWLSQPEAGRVGATAILFAVHPPARLAARSYAATVHAHESIPEAKKGGVKL